ncbi:MAG: hypothetical protein U0L77_09900 [Prevotellamassilia sp.]|nr:hypothetical protein [Prevotellamassilia sp.]
MTITSELSFWLNIVSAILTIVSFGLSGWAYFSAKKAKQYKDETIHIKDSFELEKLTSKFLLESSNFQNKTRKSDWFKGIDPTHVISPFVDTLKALASVYHLFSEKHNLKAKVHSLYTIVQQYERATKQQKYKCNDLIFEIGEILQQQAIECTKQIVHN